MRKCLLKNHSTLQRSMLHTAAEGERNRDRGFFYHSPIRAAESRARRRGSATARDVQLFAIALYKLYSGHPLSTPGGARSEG